MLSDGAMCAQHAEVNATGVCSRCGTFVCVACADEFQPGLVCETCALRLREEPVSMWAIAAKYAMYLAWLMLAVSVAGMLLKQRAMMQGLVLSVPVAFIGGAFAFFELIVWGSPRSRTVARAVIAALVFHLVAAMSAFTMMASMFSGLPEF